MMNKKVKYFISMIFMCIFFTGCTVQYNLSISNNIINEKISIIEDENLVDEELYEDAFNNAYSQYNKDGIKKYNTFKEKKNGKLYYNLSQKYSIHDFSDIRFFDECFDAYNLVYDDELPDTYILQTSQGFKCMTYEYNSIDAYQINIKVNYEVLENNADEVKDNTYIWYINNGNADSKVITIKFKEKKKEKSKDDKMKLISSNMLTIILLGLIILGLLIFSIVKNIKNKNNTI